MDKGVQKNWVDSIFYWIFDIIEIKKVSSLEKKGVSVECQGCDKI